MGTGRNSQEDVERNSDGQQRELSNSVLPTLMALNCRPVVRLLVIRNPTPDITPQLHQIDRL